jgi:hypothetical protein
MLGTAGAYGYRTYTSSTDTAAAPVITADATPSKVVPTPADSKSSRSQERFGSGSSEKLVSREEQPVTLQPGSGTPPRVVFPPLAPSAGAPPPVAPATAPPSTGSATEQSDSGAPRPIRTVRIPSDRSDASTRPVPPTTGTTSGSPKAEPTQVPSAKVTPPPRAQRGGTGPLSLDPSSSPETTETSRTQQRVLTPPAPKEAARGPSLASVPPNGGTSGNGGYLVQVSSQRSEADAKSSYRALQAKYSLLKSRQPIVRKAEVGSKGTYYRAFVGPFGSAGEASQFCDQLKSAGGQCLILRN